MAEFAKVREDVLADLRALDTEVRIVYEELVLPHWGSSDRHGFPRTLYGYVMNAFAFVDLLSQYRTGSTATRGQTRRMTNLMVDCLASPRQEAETAVRLWRHTLMHTGNPRRLVDESSMRRLRWLLHWREHLPREQHMTFSRASNETILNLGAMYLVEDLLVVANQLFSELAENRTLRDHVDTVESDLGRARFRVPT